MKGALGNNKRLTRFRLYLKMHPDLQGFEQDERDEFGREYWGSEIIERTESGQFESAWHCLMAAALGEKVFTGPHRVCRPNLEDLPVGKLICGTDDIIGFVEYLYDAIPRNIPLEWEDVFQKLPSWEMNSRSGVVELFSSGNPVSRMLATLNARAYIAALQATAVSVYASNHRRFALAA